MRLMKKLSVVLLSLCLSIGFFSFVTYAAEGQIQFTDPETKVGDMVEVKCVVRSTGGNLGNIQLSLKYDSSALRFDSGEGVAAGDEGALNCTATGTSAEQSFLIKFQALTEGQTTIEVGSANVTTESGEAVTLETGNSTVAIGAGDPSKIVSAAPASGASDVEVDVDGVKYNLSDKFADADIPTGFTKKEVSYAGQTRQMVCQETSGLSLGYLIDASGKGEFFLYNEDNATFSAFEQIDISENTSIMVLSDADKVKLPDDYKEATLTLNNKKFPVWQNASNEGFYILYAANNNGDKGYYQYDSEEGTYQRFEAPKEEKAEPKDTSLLGRIGSFITGHMKPMIVAAAVAAIIILILLIVLGVKLHNRNAELDDLYDEYGIDDDEEDDRDKYASKPAVKASAAPKREPKKEPKRQAPGEPQKEDTIDFKSFETGTLDIYQEEDIDEIDFDGYDEPDDVGVFDEADDEALIDDLDELLVEKPKKRRSHEEDDDAFKVDFIDLD